MWSFAATYYSGQNTLGSTAQVSVDRQGYLSATGLVEHLHISTVNIAPRLGNTPRKIYLPDQSYLESAENDVIDELCREWPEKNRQGFLHRLEKNSRLALVSVVLLVVFFGAAYRYGIPAASGIIVDRLPTVIDQQLGDGVLLQLDDTFFSKSELPLDTQAELYEMFEQYIDFAAQTYPDVAERAYQLELRASPVIGANAFALPDGTIILTDEIVELVDKPEQLGGIVLHEIAHVYQRHSMQTLVRQSGSSALILLLTGDASLASSLVFLLPTVLIEAGYSREFENEADVFALEVMQDNNIPLENFTLAMEQLASSHHDHDDEPTEVPLWHYFSTHPATAERLERFREANLQSQ